MAYHPLSDPGETPRTVYDVGAPPAPPTQPLAGEVKADVAIVGAGFTGLSAALHLAEAGSSVALLEANEIGWGASGRNFGQVAPYLRHEAVHALNRFGPDYGERLVAAAAGAPDLVFGLVEAHSIDCAPNHKGLIFAAHTEKALQGLDDRAAFWAQRGVSLAQMGPTETRSAIGGGDYRGAILDPRGGVINPLGFTRGLAQAAMARGARIHTRSKATRLARSGAHWRVECANGTVTASAVLLATSAYTDGLWPGLRRSVVPVRVHQLASRPLSDNLAKTILPRGQAVTDTRRMPSGVRLHPSGRLHVSTGGPYFGAVERPDRETPTKRLMALFPQLDNVEWEFSWSGWIDMTADEYPLLIEAQPGLFAALGYSGRGVGLATVFGRELARLVGGAPRDRLVVPLTRPKAVGIPGVNEIVIKAAVKYNRFRDALDLVRG